MQPKVETWDHGVPTLAKISNRYPQLVYDSLGVLLHIEWQYLQRNVPGVSTIMGPIEDAVLEAFFPTFFGGEEVSADHREILSHSVKYEGLGIP